jgi:hypothetical protein
MMPDLGDVIVGPGDVRALGATVANIGGEAPADLVGAYLAEGPVRVSDASHACGLDDLNELLISARSEIRASAVCLRNAAHGCGDRGVSADQFKGLVPGTRIVE